MAVSSRRSSRRGPWDANALHGGAPAALLMRAFERLPAPEGLSLARVTYELLRPVPVGPVEIQAEVTRPGRRVQLLEGSIFAGGVEVVRARALQVQRADPGTDGATEDTPPPPGPETGRPARVNVPHRPMFAFDAIEIRSLPAPGAAARPPRGSGYGARSSPARRLRRSSALPPPATSATG